MASTKESGSEFHCQGKHTNESKLWKQFKMFSQTVEIRAHDATSKVQVENTMLASIAQSNQQDKAFLAFLFLI